LLVGLLTEPLLHAHAHPLWESGSECPAGTGQRGLWRSRDSATPPSKPCISFPARRCPSSSATRAAERADADLVRAASTALHGRRKHHSAAVASPCAARLSVSTMQAPEESRGRRRSPRASRQCRVERALLGRNSPRSSHLFVRPKARSSSFLAALPSLHVFGW